MWLATSIWRSPLMPTLRALGADLLVLTELFLCGYPPEDLVLKPALQDRLPGRGGAPGVRDTRRSWHRRRHTLGRR